MTNTRVDVFVARGATTALLVAAATGCIDPGEPPSRDTHHTNSVRITGRSEAPDSARITVNSDECPFGVTAVPSGDFEAVTLLFSETLLWEERRSVLCRIGIDYEFPTGWQLWRPGANARGVQILPDDQRLTWVLRMRRDGQPWAEESMTTRGPRNDDLQIDLEDGEVRGEVPTACGATSAHVDVELVGELVIGSAPSSALLGTIDTIDTEIDWKRCP